MQSPIFLLNVTNGLVYPIVRGDEFVIGRSTDAEIRVNHRSVARRHTRVRVKRSTIEISDVLSTGGTKVGGVQVNQAARPLGVSLELQTGEVRWRVVPMGELASLPGDQRRAMLDVAMAHELGWSHDRMRHYLDDDQMRELLRNLVLAVDADDVRRFVRWSEEAYLDVEAGVVDVPSTATFRIAHPVEFSPARRLEWQHSLADFQLVQSFDQLHRDVYTVDDEPSIVFDEQDREQFFSHGWQVRFGRSMYVSCRFPTNGLTVVGAVEPGEPVTLWFRGDVETIPPIVYSEAYRALERVRSDSSGR